jgi:hypothetical protein
VGRGWHVAGDNIEILPNIDEHQGQSGGSPPTRVLVAGCPAPRSHACERSGSPRDPLPTSCPDSFTGQIGKSIPKSVRMTGHFTEAARNMKLPVGLTSAYL